MSPERGHVPRLRLSVIAIVVTALFASLFARLYDLQIVGAGSYQLKAEANRVREVALPAPRGRILDRNGKVLVDNRVTIVVAIERNGFDELSAERQTKLLNDLSWNLAVYGHPITPDEIRSRVNDVRYSRYAPVPLAAGVPEEAKIYFEERAADYPSVEVERTALRAYPYGPLAAAIVGYVGKINDTELAAEATNTTKPYTLNDEIGKSGVEQTFEQWLRGTPGLRRIEVDSEGNPVRVISERPPKAGDDVYLTIDADLQALAEQKVQQGLADAQARPNRDGSRNNGTTGAAVVEDPNNGQILAMASYPSYDPNMLADGVTEQEWAYLNDPANHAPFNNWAIQGQWAPGSTYKLFVGYAALMAGVMTPTKIYHDSGGYSLANCSGPHCFWRNAGGATYGNVNISRALTVSSDAYFYNVGAQFWLHKDDYGGDEALQSRLTPWGLGSPSGIALTSEKPGRVPTPQWKVDYGGHDPVWRAGDNINMAIGQGDVLVTPLQLANGYATFANGGTRYVPQIGLRAEAYQTGQVTQQFDPVVGGQVDLPPEVREPLLQGLLGVPRSGTATRAFAGFPLDDFPIAGKTGTAQVNGKADTAVFTAFGPVPNPKYQVSVFLEESGFGATAAAPVARAIFEALSGQVPLQPAGPDGLPVGSAGGLTGDTASGAYD